MTAWHTVAFAKVNLCLFLGPTRDDGRHELVTLFESADLTDDLFISSLDEGESDQVICHGVEGRNLVSDALARLREAGWEGPPLKVEIDKRIPVAAGMGGGSADAAAMLNSASAFAPVQASTLAEIALGLGADVPSQMQPGTSLGSGAGEALEPVEIGDHALLFLPGKSPLSTADVFREADRLGLPRSSTELARIHAELRETIRASERAPQPLPAPWIINDLQSASMSLRPEVGEAIERALEAGADQAIVCGSGPTVIGVFWGKGEFGRAHAAAKRLRRHYPDARAAQTVSAAMPANGGRGTGPDAPNE